MNVQTSHTIEGSAWGAVLIGLQSTNVVVKNQTKTEKTFLPDRANKKVYEEAFTKFSKVYSLLKGL
jgi:gluconokinase